MVIIGIIIFGANKLWQFTNGIRWKIEFGYKTRDFITFIEEQNQTVYSKMGIQIEKEPQGCWLEFLLKSDEKMYEEMIAERREQIFKEKNTSAIEEMKQILNDYSEEKKKAEEQGTNWIFRLLSNSIVFNS